MSGTVLYTFSDFIPALQMARTIPEHIRLEVYKQEGHKEIILAKRTDAATIYKKEYYYKHTAS